MDGLTLLNEARGSGLVVTVDGDRLKIRGPRHLEPLVQLMIAHKAAVIRGLEGEIVGDAAG